MAGFWETLFTNPTAALFAWASLFPWEGPILCDVSMTSMMSAGVAALQTGPPLGGGGGLFGGGLFGGGLLSATQLLLLQV